MANVVTHLSGKDVDEHMEMVHMQHEGYCDKYGNLSARMIMMEVTIQQWFMSGFMSIVTNVKLSMTMMLKIYGGLRRLGKSLNSLE